MDHFVMQHVRVILQTHHYLKSIISDDTLWKQFVRFKKKKKVDGNIIFLIEIQGLLNSASEWL